jgi:integrase
LKAPFKETARDRVLSDMELAAVVHAARHIGFPYGDVVELLALTGQRRQEIVALTRGEIDFDARLLRFDGIRTKNGKQHTVHLSSPARAILERLPVTSGFLLSSNAGTCFQNFSAYKRELDALSGVTGWRLHDLRRTCVSGMARLGVAPHIADKILNHQSGTISGVAAVYQLRLFA